MMTHEPVLGIGNLRSNLQETGNDGFAPNCRQNSLTRLVRRAQDNPRLEIREWQFTKLGGGSTEAEAYRVSGTSISSGAGPATDIGGF